MENEILAPFKPYITEDISMISNRSKENAEDILFNRLNSYHRNIRLATEITRTKFHDTKLKWVDGIYKTIVQRNRTKLPSCFATLLESYSGMDVLL